MASVTRQVFGEIGDSRLQTLQSAKNRQNGENELGIVNDCH